MKYIFSVEVNLLKNNFLDAVIISSIYSVLKKSGSDITFNLLIEK
jgi:hypothetical protein